MALRRLSCAAIAGIALIATTGVQPANAGTAATGPPESEGAQSKYPLILDVDMTPNPSCSDAVRGRVMVYFPPGAAVDAQAEWRVRINGETVRSGLVTLAETSATAEFQIPFPEVPAAADVQVDARIIGPGGMAGPYGKQWRDRLSRGCDPVRTVAVGDSVIWGQGLDHDHKYPHRTGQRLGEMTGRGSQTFDYSISGAVLDAPDFPADNNDAACLADVYPQDPDGDGEMEFGEVTNFTPDVFCQLERAKANALRDGTKIDLVVLNGCINDSDPFFGIPLGLTPGTENLKESVRRECSGIGAEPENPAKDVPYFSGTKVGYGGRSMQDAIEKAHALPGNPKVIVSNFYYALGWNSFPVSLIPCEFPNLTTAQRNYCREHQNVAPERYEQFTRYSAEAYRQAAEAANAKSPDGPYAVAGDGMFTLDNAALARESKLWPSVRADEAASLRAFACPELSKTPPQCMSAAVAHPTVAGAEMYVDSFLLHPVVQSWFGLGQPPFQHGFTVSRTSGPPGVEVSFDASAAAKRHRAVKNYTWYFGDGTKQVTDNPTTSHSYSGLGPNVPRLIITDDEGRRTLYEGDRPISIMAPMPTGP